MKLILIEGLPGSGKTVLAEQLYARLTKEINCKYYEESSYDNPIQKFPFHTYDFKDNKLLFDLKNHILIQWEKFSDLIIKDNFLYIMDGRFIHNTILPVYSFLGNEEDCLAIINKISGMILPIEPIFIYLAYGEIKNFEENINALRGEKWIENDLKNMSNLPIFKKNKINGKDGWVKFWNDWLQIIKKIYLQSKFNKIKIENNYINWDKNFDLIYNYIIKLKDTN